MIQLPPRGDAAEILGAAAGEWAGQGPPALIVAFLPPGDSLPATLEAMGRLWPSAARAGCEAVTQFAESRLSAGGSLQFFWFERPDSSVSIEILEASQGSDDLPLLAAKLRESLASSTGALVIADGLRFPAEPFLAEVRAGLDSGPQKIAGGLASQALPIVGTGARVFAGTTLYDSACVAMVFRGVTMDIEVVRGWEPVGPLYEVTRAENDVLYEIDGSRATEWYRRFFAADGRMAPMPEFAYRFPLIIEGPRPERDGLIRSMKAFDDPAGAVAYWGDVQTGDRVRLGMGDGGSLVEKATKLSASTRPEAAVLYSCIGREIVLGEIAEREVAAIHKVLGGVALTGFFSFGEIGPSAKGGLAFYNQTAILALLREEGG